MADSLNHNKIYTRSELDIEEDVEVVVDGRTETQKRKRKYVQKNDIEKNPTLDGKKGSNPLLFGVNSPDGKRVITAERDSENKVTVTFVYDPSLGTPPSITPEMATILNNGTLPAAGSKIVKTAKNVEFHSHAPENQDVPDNTNSFSCEIEGLDGVKIAASVDGITVSTPSGSTKMTPPAMDEEPIEGYGVSISHDLIQAWLKKDPNLKYVNDNAEGKEVLTSRDYAPAVLYALGCFNRNAPNSYTDDLCPRTIGDTQVFALEKVDGLDAVNHDEQNSAIFIKTGNDFSVYDSNEFHTFNPEGGVQLRYTPVPPKEKKGYLNFCFTIKAVDGQNFNGSDYRDLPFALKLDKEGNLDLSDANVQKFLRLLTFFDASLEGKIDLNSSKIRFNQHTGVLTVDGSEFMTIGKYAGREEHEKTAGSRNRLNTKIPKGSKASPFKEPEKKKEGPGPVDPPPPPPPGGGGVYTADARFDGSIVMPVTTTTPKGDLVTDRDGKPITYEMTTTILPDDANGNDLFHVARNGSGKNMLVASQHEDGSVSITLTAEELPEDMRLKLKAFLGVDPLPEKVVINNAQINFTESGMSIAALQPIEKGSEAAEGQGQEQPKRISFEVNARGLVTTISSRKSSNDPYIEESRSVALSGGSEEYDANKRIKNCMDIEIYHRAFHNDNCQFQYVDENHQTQPFQAERDDFDADGRLKHYNGSAFRSMQPATAYAYGTSIVRDKNEPAVIDEYNGIKFMTARLRSHRADGDTIDRRTDIMLAKDTNSNNARYVYNNGEYMEVMNRNGNPRYCYDPNDPTKLFAVVAVIGQNGAQEEVHIPMQLELSDDGKHFKVGLDAAHKTPAESDFDNMAEMLLEPKEGAKAPTLREAEIVTNPDGSKTVKMGEMELEPAAMNPDKVPKTHVKPEPPKVENVRDYGAPIKRKKKNQEEEQADQNEKESSSGPIKYARSNDDAVKAARISGWAAALLGVGLLFACVFTGGAAAAALAIAGGVILGAGIGTSVGAPIVAGFIDSCALGGPLGKIARAKRAVKRRDKQAEKYLANDYALERLRGLAKNAETTDLKNAYIKKIRKYEAKQDKLLAKNNGKIVRKVYEKKADAAAREAREKLKRDNPNATEEDLDAAEEGARKNWLLDKNDKEKGADGRWKISPDTYAYARSIIANLGDEHLNEFLQTLTPIEREILGQAIADIRDAACELMKTEPPPNDTNFNPEANHNPSLDVIQERLGFENTEYIMRCRYSGKGTPVTGRGKNRFVNRMMDNIFGVESGSFDWVRDKWQIGDPVTNESRTKNIEHYVGAGWQTDDAHYPCAFEQWDSSYRIRQDVEAKREQIRETDGKSESRRADGAHAGEVVVDTETTLDDTAAEDALLSEHLRDILAKDENVRRSAFLKIKQNIQQWKSDVLRAPASHPVARWFVRRAAGGTSGAVYEAEQEVAARHVNGADMAESHYNAAATEHNDTHPTERVDQRIGPGISV